MQSVAQDQVEGGEATALADAHRQLLTDSSIQFDLPIAGDRAASQPSTPPPPGYGPPASGPGLPPNQPQPTGGEAVPPTPSAQPDIPNPGGSPGLDGFMQVFLWAAAGIALALLLYWLFTYFRDRGGHGAEAGAKKGRGTRDEAGWRPEEGQAVQLLDEADVLANAGRYDEAARLLLHRSIGEIDAHRPDLVRPALTSRDIADHPLLPRGPAAAFARIAALVERSLFGRRPLGADDWQACRAAYREFAFVEGWRG